MFRTQWQWRKLKRHALPTYAGFTFPSSKSQEQLLREVYGEANVDPRKVVYVEAHGTGTKAGDPVELSAISKVLCQDGREKPLRIGSVKSNMGHSETASGKCWLSEPELDAFLEMHVVIGLRERNCFLERI